MARCGTPEGSRVDTGRVKTSDQDKIRQQEILERFKKKHPPQGGKK